MSFIEDRKADLDQLGYLLKHKKDVYMSGRELGAPRLQLLKHDADKFLPSRWGAYRDYWFGPQSVRALGDRSKVPEDISQKFRASANKHIESNKHHQHKRSQNPTNLKDVPKNIRKEMLSDWHSVSKRTSGKEPDEYPDVKTWAKNKNLDWMHKLGMIGSKNFGGGFNPDYSPADLERMGVYSQVYGDEPSEASMKEWPERWFYGPDKLGWLEWYERYYSGRRLPEVDHKQIQRWKSFKARHGAQYVKNPSARRKAALRNWAIDAEKLLNEKNANLNTGNDMKSKARQAAENMVKKAELQIGDIENEIGTFFDDKLEEQIRGKIDYQKSKRFPMRHPYLTGIPTLGIAPAVSEGRAKNEIIRDLAKKFPDIRNKVIEKRELAAQRAHELRRAQASASKVYNSNTVNNPGYDKEI